MRHRFTITIAYLLPRCSCGLPRFARWAFRPLIVIGTHRNQVGTVRELCGNPRRPDAIGSEAPSAKPSISLPVVTGVCGGLRPCLDFLSSGGVASAGFFDPRG